MLGRIVRTIAAACMAASVWTAPATANDGKTVDAFRTFLTQQNYDSANFYLQSGLIDPSRLPTGQLFYRIWRDAFWERRADGLVGLDAVYNYLQRLRPFDLNATFDCRHSYEDERRDCTILNDISTGMPVAVFSYFAQRGLDLNRAHPNILPATYDIIDRLGIGYTIADIQALGTLGMQFGDETYSPILLAAHREGGDGYRSDYGWAVMSRDTPRLPDNHLSIPSFNFMDVLVVALANDVSGRSDGRSAKGTVRDTSLCQYITYASQTFRPSFDYLRYLLESRDTFRADRIGVRERDGNQISDAFPAPCVNLVAGMARNHARLNDVVSHFGAVGDVETARWLLALRPAPTPAAEPPHPEPSAAPVAAVPQAGAVSPASLPQPGTEARQ